MSFLLTGVEASSSIVIENDRHLLPREEEPCALDPESATARVRILRARRSYVIFTVEKVIQGQGLGTETGSQSIVHDTQLASTSSKKRMHWSPSLHQKFLAAIDTIEKTEDVTPSAIHKLMQGEDVVPTRLQIGSHLQKHYIAQKRTTHAGEASGSGANTVLAAPRLVQNQQSHATPSSQEQTEATTIKKRTAHAGEASGSGANTVLAAPILVQNQQSHATPSIQEQTEATTINDVGTNDPQLPDLNRSPPPSPSV
ncbi:unnamed protein product [Cochlearia groenlandica]